MELKLIVLQRMDLFRAGHTAASVAQTLLDADL
jgi:hypothetical protein